MYLLHSHEVLISQFVYREKTFCNTFHAAFSLTMSTSTCTNNYSYASFLEILYTCLVCKKGYNGTNCEARCPYPSYGLGCQKQCNCIDRDCEHVSGCMQSAKGNPLSL